MDGLGLEKQDACCFCMCLLLFLAQRGDILVPLRRLRGVIVGVFKPLVAQLTGPRGVVPNHL